MSKIKFIEEREYFNPVELIITHDKYKKFTLTGRIDTRKKDKEIIFINDFMIKVNSILDELYEMGFKQIYYNGENRGFTKLVGKFSTDLIIDYKTIYIFCERAYNRTVYAKHIEDNFQNTIKILKLFLSKNDELKTIYDEIDKI